MVSMEAFGNGKKTAGSGSFITIVFSHDTNMPSLLRPNELHSVVELSPQVLMSNAHMAFWTDPRTLVIYYPAVKEDSLLSVSADQLTVTFVAPRGGERTSSCVFPINIFV